MTYEPRRIQLSRKKGWRMPPDTVSVARPTRWGNPWTVAACLESGYSGDNPLAAAQTCVDAYRAWLLGQRHWSHGIPLAEPPDPTPLCGKNLACWCKVARCESCGSTESIEATRARGHLSCCPERKMLPGDPCHADVLLELANE